jgi:hypothetical protein
MTDTPTDRERRRPRSARYPGVPLSDAIEFCKKLDEKGLDGLPAEAIAAGLGYGSIKTNAFSTRLSAARQFGLLDLNEKGHTITPLARGLIHPISQSSLARLNRDAVAAPPLYADLLARLSGRKLPDAAALANVLYHQFQITSSAKDAAAQAFLDSTRFAGLVDTDDMLQNETIDARGTPAPPGPDLSFNRDRVRIDLHLWGRDAGKIVQIRAPESISNESYDRLIEALRLHIQIGGDTSEEHK